VPDKLRRDLPFICGSFRPMSYNDDKASVSGALWGRRMNRYLGLLLLLGTLLIAAPRSASAVPHGAAQAGAPLPVHSVELVSERHGFFFWRRHFYGRPRPDVGVFERKGVGARFWGGPYWGYGARWGHPCDNCRSACVGGERSAYCERCRMRCGW
jgi:hypothetical protein